MSYVWINVVYLETGNEETLGKLNVDCLAEFVITVLLCWRRSLYLHGMTGIRRKWNEARDNLRSWFGYHFPPWGGGTAGASSKGNRTKYGDLSHVVTESYSWHCSAPLQAGQGGLTPGVLYVVCSGHRSIAKVFSKASAVFSHVSRRKQKWHLFKANWVKVDCYRWCQVTSKIPFNLNIKNPAQRITFSFQKWYLPHTFLLPTSHTSDARALLFWLGSSLWDFIQGS